MATPEKHAVVTASGYERWSHCTAAPRFEEQFPSDGGTVYTAEGQLAHSVCELFGRRKFLGLTTRKFNSELKKLKENELWQDEMTKTAEAYVDFLAEKACEYEHTPQIRFEVRVDLSDYVPEGFGTCDCVMIGDDTLRITDYKHGKGVPVSSINNGQMRLYALGALKYFYPLYGDSIKKIYTAIVQPRVTDQIVEECITVDELRTWGENEVKPIATAAYNGSGVFNPGDWCRFCRGKAQCRARAEHFAGFSEYVDAVPAGRIEEEKRNETLSHYFDPKSADCPTLSDVDVGKLLTLAQGLVAWYEDLQEYARGAILAGKVIPGWKVVAGRSIRAFSDEDAALEAMKNAGYDEAILFDRKPKSLAQLEKLVGNKAKFAELMGELIVQPLGKPTLVTEDDKRAPYTLEAGPNEFAGVTDR